MSPKPPVRRSEASPANVPMPSPAACGWPAKEPAAPACLAVAVTWRSVRVPVLAGFLVSAGAIGGYLALTTLRDRVVHERVVVGRPAAAVKTDVAARRGPV